MRIFYTCVIYIVFSSLFLLNPIVSISQEVSGNEPVAIEYFKARNYAKALPIFTVLINRSPDNAMYNYYYGICLIKNNRFETAAKEALLNAVVDKTPTDCNFYLGNYFQAIENWGEAIDFYKRYKGSKQERRELEFDKYLDLCMKRINPFKVLNTNEKSVFVDTVKTVISQPDEKNFPIPDSLKVEWFNFQINDQLTYHSITDFKSEAAKILFVKAWIATNKNDSIVKNTDILRKAHAETNNVTTRIGLVQRIVDSEQQSYKLLNDREKYFEQVRAKESGYWEKAGADATLNFAREIADREKSRNDRILRESKKKEVVQESVAAEKVAANNIALETKANEEKLKAAAADQDKIVYKVQIGSFLNGKLTPAFKTMYAKLSKFRKIEKYTDAKKCEIYTVGNFTEYADASLLKNQLILEGAKGAFLAAYKNGERIPVSRVVKKQPVKK
ncbi:MAG: tetratricopeptide repeat protein [Mariniphaga sp.]